MTSAKGSDPEAGQGESKGDAGAKQGVKKPATASLGSGAPLGGEAKLEAGAQGGKSADGATATQAADAAAAAMVPMAEIANAPKPGDAATAVPSAGQDAASALGSDLAAAGGAAGPSTTGAVARSANVTAPPPPEVQFAHANHEPIVSGVKAQLMPHGGSMEIRLDPPELGALKVMVEMRDGTMTATFQTSNEEATRLLSHSLNQLKHVLEGQGVSVERLQVQQAPKSDSQSAGGDDARQQNSQQGDWQDEHAARQEQQRKESLHRMWRRIAGIADPIDVTA
jgi:flagellar hook-length control protein FliK